MEPTDQLEVPPGALRRIAGAIGRHKAIRATVLGAVLAVAVAILIGRAADYAELLDHLTEVDAYWIPVLLGSELVAVLGYVIAYRATARCLDGPRLPFWLTARVVAAGLGATVVATSVGGLGVSYWALRRAGVGHHGAMARVIGFNTLLWGLLGAAAAAAGVFELLRPNRVAELSVIVAWLVAVPACFLAAFWVSSPKRVDRMTRTAGAGRIRRLYADAIAGVVIVRRILTDPRRNVEALAGTALYWGGLLLGLWAALRAFGIELGLTPLLLAYATGYAVMILPLPVGGAGGVDAAMTYALTLVGVPLAPALLGVFVFRVFNFWLPLIPALIVTGGLKRIRDELPLVEYPGGRSEAGALAR